MKERSAEDWYGYHEAEWETIAVILHSAPKCYLVKLLGGTSDHVVEQMIISKGFKLDEIEWYRTEQRK